MNITKQQLKRIILEELESVLSEAFPGRSGKRLPGQRAIPVRKAPEEEESKAQQMLRRKKQSSSTTTPEPKSQPTQKPKPQQTQKPKPQPVQKPARVKKAAPKLPPHTIKMARNSDGSWTATACTKDGKVCGKGTYKSKVLQVARGRAADLARADLAKKLKN